MRCEGSCHCGMIRFHVEGHIHEVIECSCTHCRKKGYLFWLLPRDRVVLSTSKSDLGSYTFDKHVIQHHFCPHCGCAPLGFGYVGSGDSMALINVRCLDNVDLTALPVVRRDDLTA
ncbi:GFA family protein [Gilvimarinus sp. F26214L]|uniref:GFA family protein n=1 Tax=Gilvimarinus sp. DZF01 TaxID=3461371 RepID=UPI0040462A0D